MLEVRVHLDLAPEMLPDDDVLVTIDLDALAVERVAQMPVDPAAFGDDWIAGRRTPVLEVPSAIVPETGNLLLNPAHRAAAGARISGVRPFTFDRRLWLPL